MRQLILFFLPRVFPVISIVFFGVLSFLMAVRLALGSESDLSVLDFFLIGLFFPLVSFFNSYVYVASNISWIVLAPVSKRHILLSNMIINFYKLLVIVFYIMVFNISLYPDYWLSGRLFVFDYGQPMDAGTLQFLIGLMGMTTILLFIILPGPPTTSTVPKTTITSYKTKSFLYPMAAIIVVVFVFLINIDFVSKFFPSAVATSFIFACVAVGAIGLTLIALRVYYNHHILALFGILIFAGSFGPVLILASSNLKNPNQSLEKKLEDFAILGIYGDRYFIDVKTKMENSQQQLIDLKWGLVQRFFEKGNDIRYQELLKSWLRKCDLQKDAFCRLASYTYYKEDKEMYLKLLKQGCTNELRSCSSIIGVKSASLEEQLDAQSKLLEGCKKIPLEQLPQVCK